MRQRGLMLLQLAGSAAILGFLPGNVFKAVAFLAWWAVTFRKITRRELIFYLVALVLFSVLDYLTLRQGIFRFDHPDFLLMPCYEPLLWGYLLLHTVHMVDGPIPRRRTSLGLAFTIAFMLPFLLITDPLWLFCARRCGPRCRADRLSRRLRLGLHWLSPAGGDRLGTCRGMDRPVELPRSPSQRSAALVCHHVWRYWLGPSKAGATAPDSGGRRGSCQCQEEFP